jgi:hypothetical protein
VPSVCIKTFGTQDTEVIDEILDIRLQTQRIWGKRNQLLINPKPKIQLVGDITINKIPMSVTNPRKVWQTSLSFCKITSRMLSLEGIVSVNDL